MRGNGPFSKRQVGRGRAFARGVILFGLVLFSGVTVARAEMGDPFAADGDWVSIEDFAAQATQRTKEAPPPPPAPEAKTEEPAAPSRPLSYPAPPARAIPSSTPHAGEAEENTLTEAPQWTSFDAYENQAQSKPIVLGSDGDGFAIRYSTLPSAAVRSRPASRVTSSRLDLEAKSRAARQKQEAAKEGKTQTVKKADADNKACEAYADYKRRQLAEIESDRKTLAQLKQALSDLGLVDRLNLATEAGQLRVEPKGRLAQPLPDESPKATP